VSKRRKRPAVILRSVADDNHTAPTSQEFMHA
jgi:hypothetical protein